MRDEIDDRETPEHHLRKLQMRGYSQATLVSLKIPKPNLLVKSHRPNTWTARFFMGKDLGYYFLVESKGYTAKHKTFSTTRIESRDVSGVIHVDGKLTVLDQEYKFKYLVESKHTYIITSEDPRAKD